MTLNVSIDALITAVLGCGETNTNWLAFLYTSNGAD